MKQMAIFVAVTVLALLATLFYRLGGYKEVTLTYEEDGPWTVVSRQHFGAYHKIVPIMEEVEVWVKKNGDPCRFTFGEFLDDPEQVEEDRLKSHTGCVVEKDLATTPLPEGYSIRVLPRRWFVKATFDGAPSIGPMKVYPKAQRFIQEQNLTLDGPIVEMYEIRADHQVRTRYFFPVKAR